MGNCLADSQRASGLFGNDEEHDQDPERNVDRALRRKVQLTGQAKIEVFKTVRNQTVLKTSM